MKCLSEEGKDRCCITTAQKWSSSTGLVEHRAACLHCGLIRDSKWSHAADNHSKCWYTVQQHGRSCDILLNSSYPTNSSNRDTSNSGGMLNTESGMGSFFCFLCAAGTWGEATTKQSRRKMKNARVKAIGNNHNRWNCSSGFFLLLLKGRWMNLKLLFPESYFNPPHWTFKTWLFYLDVAPPNLLLCRSYSFVLFHLWHKWSGVRRLQEI